MQTKIQSMFAFFRAHLGWSLKHVAQNYFFIAIPFYLNILCKNVSCDMGLTRRDDYFRVNFDHFCNEYHFFDETWVVAKICSILKPNHHNQV